MAEKRKEFRGKHYQITNTILQAFYKVYFKMGFGFLEKVYEKTLLIELNKLGLNCIEQLPIKVYYDGAVVGDYFADLIVNDLILVELKTADSITAAHEAQLINYLKSTKYEVGLLLNFGPKPGFIRRLLDNDRKGSLDWMAKIPPQQE